MTTQELLEEISPLQQALSWIINNVETIEEQIGNGELFTFEYPEYWHMPNYIAHQLSPDAVDHIQNITEQFVHERFEGNLD